MKTVILNSFIGLILITGCKTAPDSKNDIVTDAIQARDNISDKYPEVDQLFEEAYGYVIFPNVGAGAYIIGGASGDGAVYANEELIGYADMKELDVGLQVGGKSFVEVLFFENAEDLDQFKTDEYKLKGNASAVILDEGISRSIEFTDGVAVVTMPESGAMAGVSIGGQSFEYWPAE